MKMKKELKCLKKDYSQHKLFKQLIKISLKDYVYKINERKN